MVGHGENGLDADVQDNLRLNVLHALLSKYMVRRLREDVLDLPQLLSRKILCSYNKQQTSLLKNIWTAKTSAGEHMSDIAVQRLFQQARLVTMHPDMLIQLPEGAANEQADLKTAWNQRIADFKAGKLRAEESPRFIKAYDLITDYHKTHPYERTVVFTVFVRSIDIMDILLQQRGYNSEVIRVDEHNDIDLSMRQLKVRQFGVTPAGSVLLTTFNCLKEGPSIRAASHVIFLDQTWAPVNEEQAISRVYQHGQQKNVTVETLYESSWIDVHLNSLRNRKRYLGQSLLENGSPAHSGSLEPKKYEYPWPKYSDDPAHEDPDRAHQRTLAEFYEELPCINHSAHLDPQSFTYQDMSLFNDVRC